MKKISKAIGYEKYRTGSYKHALLDKDGEYYFSMFSNNYQRLVREKKRITKINADFGNRLIIVDTTIENYGK